MEEKKKSKIGVWVVTILFVMVLGHCIVEFVGCVGVEVLPSHIETALVVSGIHAGLGTAPHIFVILEDDKIVSIPVTNYMPEPGDDVEVRVVRCLGSVRGTCFVLEVSQADCIYSMAAPETLRSRFFV